MGLDSKDVTERAAAVRTLAATGTFDDVGKLVEIAWTDKSPSVRLHAAGGAADLATRCMGDVPLEERRRIVDWVKSFDPGHNPSLLMVLAAVPERAVADRLGRILRDPRYDVRAGAATALRRMAWHTDADWLRDAVQGWLAEGKHPPDAVLELVKLAGEVGWAGLERELAKAESAGRPHGAAVEEALQRLKAREQPQTWRGLWVSWGAGIGEPEPEAPVAWRWVGEGAARDGARLVWAPRPGAEGLQIAMLADGLTFWRLEGKALLKVASDLADELGADRSVALGLASELEAIEGVVAPRVRARLLWRAGALDRAEALLEPLADDKKPRLDVLWMLAEVKCGLGDLDSARELVDQALEGAPKKAPWRAEAEALRASLGR